MKKLLLLLIVSPILLISQTQIGSDIDGEAVEDFSGHSVYISSNGNIIAIGARWNDANGNNSGQVRVYQNISGTWTQLGSDIDGEAADDENGWSVSLSSNGSIVAIGAVGNDANGNGSGHVRVYENIGGIWTQIGADIDGEAAADSSGWSVSLSSDGSIVAIGARGNSDNGFLSGHVRVFENIGGNWTQIGADIDGEAVGDLSGSSVSLSSDGSIVAIGAIGNVQGNSGFGNVRVYENISSTWTQIGSDIIGEAASDTSGSSVSLSSNGSIIAIGALQNDGNGNNSGHVRVFENIGGNWTQIGADIDGEVEGDHSGFSVSLSSDGSVVAISAIFNDGNGSNSGHVRVYKNILGIWTQMGLDIDGEAADDQSGWSISLSSDGSIVAIGAKNNDGNGIDSGHVRVYDLTNVLSEKNFKLDYFSIYPNPVKKIINIELNQGIELKNINIYNALGQFISSTKNLKINTSNLTSGIYFIEIETNKGKSAKKIIIE